MPRPTLLLVEDDLDIRDTLQDSLEQQGFDVVPAENGKQAIDFLTLNDPPGADLVVLDLMIPMLSGWEVLDRMSRNGRLAGIPVVVLSAVATAKPDGARVFVRKPFSLDGLLKAIQSCLLPGHEPSAAAAPA